MDILQSKEIKVSVSSFRPFIILSAFINAVVLKYRILGILNCKVSEVDSEAGKCPRLSVAVSPKLAVDLAPNKLFEYTTNKVSFSPTISICFSSIFLFLKCYSNFEKSKSHWTATSIAGPLPILIKSKKT